MYSERAKRFQQLPQSRTLPQSDQTICFIAWGLVLAGLFLWPVAPLAGLTVAYISFKHNRQESVQSHYKAIKTTFWIGYALIVLALILFVIPFPNKDLALMMIIGFIFFGVATLVCSYRAIKGLVYASKLQPYW